MTAPTHYEVLGVRPDCDPAGLRRAYVALAQRHHPDVPGGDPQRMRDLNEAWATLGDPIRRQRYDRALAAARAPRPAAARIIDHEEYHLDLGDEDLVAGLDDQPIGPAIVLPRSLALLPVGLFACSVMLGVVGVIGGIAPVLGFAFVTFVLSTMLFIASPFLALYASRRRSTGARDEETYG